jgi:hypothetical protein
VVSDSVPTTSNESPPLEISSGSEPANFATRPGCDDTQQTASANAPDVVPDVDKQLTPGLVDIDMHVDSQPDVDGNDGSEVAAGLGLEEQEHGFDVHVPSDRDIEEIDVTEAEVGEVEEKPRLGQEDVIITSPEDQRRRIYVPAANIVPPDLPTPAESEFSVDTDESQPSFDEVEAEPSDLRLAQPQPPRPTLPHLSLSPPPPLITTSLLSSHEPTTPTSPPPTQLNPHSHPLLQGLAKARTQYDHIQRGFHACHVALESLIASLPSTSTTASSSNLYPHHYQRYPTPLNASSGTDNNTHSGVIPEDILNAIIQRLDDYTGDARVELEIRVSDEEVLGRGYEALLVLPGA